MLAMDNFFGVSDDIIDNIMLRLPARSFAAAACVNHFWNGVTEFILSRPRLVSGVSLAVSSEIAVDEALEMALSKPIRPHFALAFVGAHVPIGSIHDMITRKIGTDAILITSGALGIIGLDSITNKLEDVNWDDDFDADDVRGLTVVIGCVPGLKMKVLPLLRSISEPELVMVDKLISDVRAFTVSVSGYTNPDPVGIMLFGVALEDNCIDLKPILAEIDTKISRETVMIGDLLNFSICTNRAFNRFDATRYSREAVALVFARDNQNTEVEIKFHVGNSSGISPTDTKLEIINVAEYHKDTSYVLARREGGVVPFDASNFIASVYPLTEDKVYFGAIKETITQDGGTPINYTEFYEVAGTHQNVFEIAGLDLNPGDTCTVYHCDMEKARDSLNNVYNRFNSLIGPRPRRVLDPTVPRNEKVFGGILFVSPSRGEKFFKNTMTDGVPFIENFPQVALGGMYCFEPVGRAAVLEGEEGSQSEEERFNMQVFNAAHLVMSYKEKA